MAIFFLMARLSNILFFVLGGLCLAGNVSTADGATAPKPVKCKKLLSDAKTAMKNGRDQEKVEKQLLEIVNREDITNAQRADIYFTAGELQRSVNKAENMKLYLKQPYDTIKFFSTILRMHQHLLDCDSVESQPDETGAVKYKYRSKSRDLLKNYRLNLLNGGKFLLRRDKYSEAYSYFDMYIRSAKSPILQSYNAIRNDTLLPRVAYWATISAYNAKQPQFALKYIDDAISGVDNTLRILLQEYKVRCYETLGDKERWMESMLQGSMLYPQHDYFYLHLMDVYTENNLYDDGIALCERMLKDVGNRSIYWLGESQMYLSKKDYDACIVASDQALALDSMALDAYYNKGISCYNKAILFAATVCNDIRNPKCREDRRQLTQLYRDALYPMEQYRRLAPEDAKRWASPLYYIYLNLNKGKEFAEMEKILNAL